MPIQIAEKPPAAPISWDLPLALPAAAQLRGVGDATDRQPVDRPG
jgi:hypothetical protein